MIIKNNIGLEISIPQKKISDTEWLFGEDQSRYILISNKTEKLIQSAKQNNVKYQILGSVKGNSLKIKNTLEISVKELIDYNKRFFYNYKG